MANAKSVHYIDNESWISIFLAGFLSVILFLSPLFPDIKLTRPKLLLLETGLYSLLFLWIGIGFFKAKLYLRRSLLIWPVVIYCITTTIFYYFSPDRHVALNELKRSLLSLSAYFVVANIILSERERSWILYSWMFGSLLAVIYGVLQHSGGFLRIEVPKMDRIMSTFGNPIFFAAHIVVSLPVAFGLLIAKKNLYEKIVPGLLIIFGVIALYLTKTRAAYIGFAASILVFFWLNIKSIKLKITLLTVVLMLFGLFASLTKNIWARQQAHLLIWRDTLSMWSNSPWFGTGPGTFHIYFPQFASDELKAIWPQDKFIVNDAHNEFIQYLSETGIVGFGIFLWLLVSFFKNAFTIAGSQKGPSRYVMSGLIASACGLLVQNFFSVDMRFIISAVYLFAIMGIIDSFNDQFWIRDNLTNLYRTGGLMAVGILSFFSFQKVLQPYIAHRKVASTPDFFDKKVLEPAKTISDLEALVKKYPDQASIYEKLGWVYSKEKKWPQAIQNYKKANELNPKTSGPLNNLGNIYFLIGDRENAIKYWNKSLDIKPGQVDSRLNLATAYYYKGQLKQATDELKTVLELQPGNEKAIVMLKQMVE